MTLWWAILATAAAAGAVAPDCSLAPGWQQHGRPRSHTPDNLFEYMDGNAEGYLIYGFRGMNGVTCRNGGDELLIDVSEMADEDAAYGIFTANRDPNAPLAALGMGGQVVPRRAAFVKGRFYVEIAANPEKDHSPSLRAFAAALERRIEGRTRPPDALGWFTPANLESVRLVPESVLGIRLLERGYVAQYTTGKAFVVHQESPQGAAAVMSKLRARFAQAAGVALGDEAFQAADKYLGNICIFRKGAYVAGWVGVADPASAAAELLARLP